MILSNFHTHTSYCDGLNTPEELVKAAVKLGFTQLGFSGHAYSIPESHYAMSIENTRRYFDEITCLKKKYENEIEILCGIECDLYSDIDTSIYDYVIASSHSILKNGEYLLIDETAEIEKDNLNKYYNNNFDAYAKDYFNNVIKAVEKYKPDIIGHLDIITKYVEVNNRSLSENYYKAAEEAVLKLIKYDIPFEINTGAMSKGYRSIPYPDERLLKFICKNGGSIMINSDCHNAEHLNYAFDYAKELAVKCGFDEYAIFTSKGKMKIRL